MTEATETTQTVLDENESVEIELDDGARLIEIDDPDRYDSVEYRIETPIASPETLEDARRAELWIALYALTGGFRPPTIAGSYVPVDVALEGTPAIAVYLYAVAGQSSEDIADRFGFDSRRTVWDYLSTIRRRAADQGVDL